MDTIYAHEKDNIMLDIEKSGANIYARIDCRKTDMIGLSSNKHLHIYTRRLLN